MMRSSTFKVLAVAMMLAVATHSAGADRMLLKHKKPTLLQTTVVGTGTLDLSSSADGLSYSKVKGSTSSDAITDTAYNAGGAKVSAKAKGTDTSTSATGVAVSDTVTSFKKKSGKVVNVDAETIVFVDAAASYKKYGNAKVNVGAGAVTVTDKSASLALAGADAGVVSTKGGSIDTTTIADSYQEGKTSGAFSEQTTDISSKGYGGAGVTSAAIAGTGTLHPDTVAVAGAASTTSAVGKNNDVSVTNAAAVETGPGLTAANSQQDISASTDHGVAQLDAVSGSAVETDKGSASGTVGVSAKAVGENAKVTSSSTTSSSVTTTVVKPKL